MKQLTHTWNPNYIRRNTVIQIVIVSLAFLMLIRVWPCNLVKTHHVSKQKAVTNYKELSGDPFTNSDKKLQTVTFIGNHIEQIKIYLSCSPIRRETGFYSDCIMKSSPAYMNRTMHAAG